MRRRTSTAFVATLVSLVVALGVAPAASAIGQTPVPSWMTNGKLYASAAGNGRIYLGGQFTQVRSTPLGTPGPRFTVKNLGAIVTATGEGDGSFDPLVTHATATAFVRDLALSPDGTRLYIAGRFDAVDGVPARNVAAIDTATGTVDTAFLPTVGTEKSQVVALLMSSDGMTLYAGGKFRKVEGEAHINLVALDTTDGSPRTWVSSTNDTVRAMDFSSDGATIFIVGAFSLVDGQSRESIARISTATGALDPWAVPGSQISGPPMTGWSVDASAGVVYGGFGRGPNWFGAYSTTTGNQIFRRDTVGNVQKVLLSPDGSQLFVAGHFGTGSLTQTFRECGNPQFRGLLSASPTTGTVSCSWIPQLEPHGNNFEGIWDLTLTTEHLWFVGNFTHVNGVAQANVARAAL